MRMMLYLCQYLISSLNKLKTQNGRAMITSSFIQISNVIQVNMFYEVLYALFQNQKVYSWYSILYEQSVGDMVFESTKYDRSQYIWSECLAMEIASSINNGIILKLTNILVYLYIVLHIVFVITIAQLKYHYSSIYIKPEVQCRSVL